MEEGDEHGAENSPSARRRQAPAAARLDPLGARRAKHAYKPARTRMKRQPGDFECLAATAPCGRLPSFCRLRCCSRPALWNGFALLQYDTGGYLARWYEGTLVPSRAVVYGLHPRCRRAAGDSGRCCSCSRRSRSGSLALMLRAHGLGGGRCCCSASSPRCRCSPRCPGSPRSCSPTFSRARRAGALSPGVARRRACKRWERIGLIILIAVSAATHSATHRRAVGARRRRRLALARRPHAHAARAARPRRRWRSRSAPLMVFAADAVVAKRLAWTPGGFALSFGRMLQDGIVKKYLDQHCPDPALAAVRLQGPIAATTPTCGSGAATCSTGSAASPASARRWRRSCSTAWSTIPLLQIKTAAIATARQLIAVHTGEGVLTTIWHTYAIIEKFTPQLVPAMRAARQQHGELSFTAINDLHYPLALDRDGAAARHPGARLAQDDSRRRSANSPPPSRSRCSAMPSCAGRCPIRTTAMARAWFGSPCSWLS